jgi:hypothetical protein
MAIPDTARTFNYADETIDRALTICEVPTKGGHRLEHFSGVDSTRPSTSNEPILAPGNTSSRR